MLWKLKIIFKKFQIPAVVSFIAGSCCTFISCTPAFQGEYADPTKAEIVDDRWNETDARKTAEHLVNACLEKVWLKEFKAAHQGQKPVVIVDDVQNRTDEHIDTKALTEYIQDELINSGKVSFVNAEKRQKILDEIKFQQSGAVSKSTAKSTGKQVGADFLMGGAIASYVGQMEELKTVNYQTSLTLTNIETSVINWSQKYEIKKRFKRSGVGL